MIIKCSNKIISSITACSIFTTKVAGHWSAIRWDWVDDQKRCCSIVGLRPSFRVLLCFLFCYWLDFCWFWVWYLLSCWIVVCNILMATNSKGRAICYATDSVMLRTQPWSQKARVQVIALRVCATIARASGQGPVNKAGYYLTWLLLTGLSSNRLQKAQTVWWLRQRQVKYSRSLLNQAWPVFAEVTMIGLCWLVGGICNFRVWALRFTPLCHAGHLTRPKKRSVFALRVTATNARASDQGPVNKVTALFTLLAIR
jgi:hypothetical protein